MHAASWRTSTLQRAATLSYTFAEEVHSLVDADAGPLGGLYEPGAYAPPAQARVLDPLRKKIAVCGLVLSGTLISTLGKLAYQVQSVGRDGTTVKPFEKPWFLVLLMFAGMGMNLPLSLFLDLIRLSRRRVKALVGGGRLSAEPAALLQQQQQQQQMQLQMQEAQRRQQEGLYTPLLQYDQWDDELPSFEDPPVLGEASPSVTAQYWHHHFRQLFQKQLLLLLLPTLFDLVGAALLNIGLLSVTASATQMMRQSLLPFAALLGVGLSRKRLNGYHAAGLTGCLLGLGMVAGACLASGYGGSVSVSTSPQQNTITSSSSITSSSNNRAAMAAGMGMIVLSQLVAAGQLLLIDQSSWNSRLQLSPLKIVGCEGCLGMLIVMFVVLPLADISSITSEGRGLSEDIWDTLVMIANRPLLQILLLVYTGSLQAYNICGMVTAGELSAVDTTLMQAVRTLFVWVTNLVVYAVAAALRPDSSSDGLIQQQEQALHADGPARGQPARDATTDAGSSSVTEQHPQATTLSQAEGVAEADPAAAQASDLQQQEQQEQQQQQMLPIGPQRLRVLPPGGRQLQQQHAVEPDRQQVLTHLQQQQHGQQQQQSLLHRQDAQAVVVAPSPQQPVNCHLQGQQGELSVECMRHQLHHQLHSRDRPATKGKTSSSQGSLQQQVLLSPGTQRQHHQQPGGRISGPSSTSSNSMMQVQAAQQHWSTLTQHMSAAAAATASAAAVSGGLLLAAAAPAAKHSLHAAAHTSLLALPPVGGGAVVSAGSDAVAAASAVVAGLPGEPWLVWSFLQAAGFILLVAAAITYSRGDSERWRRQLEAEAALIFADMPPGGAGGGGSGSRAASVASSSGYRPYPFTANMDIDSAAFLSSVQRPRMRDYGVTPTSFASPVLQRSVSGVLEGASPSNLDRESVLEEPQGASFDSSSSGGV